MRPLAYLVPLATALLAGCGNADSSPSPSPGDADRPGAPDAATPSTDAADPRVAIADTARIKGDPDAPVWVIEISDFQCPFCREWQQTTWPALQREYIATGRAKIAYVNLPLPNHQHARLAAEAAMCAGAQGRFWPLHDAIFATQDRWARLADARPVFDSLASTTGVAMDAWAQCVDSGVMQPLIQRDYERSVGSGANSTPTFLIVPDSTIRGAQPAMLIGAAPIADFRSAIDALLARRTPTRE